VNPQGEGKIEYLTHTWNYWKGCTRNCPYCYVPRTKSRSGLTKEQIMKPGFLSNPRELEAPLRLKVPGRIGVTYTGDLFNDDVPVEAIEKILGVIRKCQQEKPDHRFILLTKNPGRYGAFDIPGNAWCGTSVTGGHEDLNTEDERVLNHFLDVTPKGRRFLSLEPFVRINPDSNAAVFINSWILNMDWVIIGGMTGKGALPTNQGDLEGLIWTCREWRVPVFVKSNAKYYEKIQEYPSGLLLPHEKLLTGGSHE